MMPRVASLYLPDLAIDRLRRIERAKAGRRPEPAAPIHPAATDEADWLPPARWPENTKERAQLAALTERKAAEANSSSPLPPSSARGEELGSRIANCSCPRSGGWRPGARWAQGETGSDQWLERRSARQASKKAALMAEIEALPLHQRPPVRELGRRSEAMPNPFRPMLSDEAGSARAAPEPGSRYDLGGAFWQQGRTLGGEVARAVGGKEKGGPAPSSSLLRCPCGSAAAAGTSRREGQKMVIAAACPEAQALGLAPGMAITQAGRWCLGSTSALPIRTARPPISIGSPAMPPGTGRRWPCRSPAKACG
jgi:hypothetical protein